MRVNLVVVRIHSAALSLCIPKCFPSYRVYHRRMKLADYYTDGLCYEDFLTKYGSEVDRGRWQRVYDQTRLNSEQESRIKAFVREMHVLCMAGTWCGDCAEQCPIFSVFEQMSPTIHIRYVDRDAYQELKESLTICGGARVPHCIFFSEDLQEVGRYGDRTLAKYRQMAASLAGPACSTGELASGQQHAEVVGNWLDEFERVQLILRTSPRLRAKHSD